ncbi:hypothetical protein [Brotaphodocola sp.]|uniref:hypothetical protein n=1 Tax=Brotaphodocola sp. TaxID=3073577 RepID=UPI003D7F048D
MKKQTKIVAVASAAAMLAIGASMTSFAATGWVEEDGQWYYYDKDGNRVEDEWKKSGDNWYWLDSEENGAMATDKIVEDDDDTYYVDANGVMVKNTWVKVVNEDQDDDDPAEYRYYYMQNSGKAYKASSNGSKVNFKTIDGKRYAFDEDGKMLYGWIDEDDATLKSDDSDWETATYYLGSWEDGSLKTGWQKITVYDDDTEKEDDYDYWFNFQSNGKKRVNKEDKKINGKHYAFDERGVMVYEWALASNGQASAASISNWKYFNSPEDGARATKGWFKVVAPQDGVDNTFKDYNDQTFAKGDSNDENERWYYADGDGELYAGEIKKIKGKYYGFYPENTDKAGSMLTGLCALVVEDGKITQVIERDMDADDLDDCMDGDGDYAQMYGNPNASLYYFGDNEDTDGAMKTGTTTINLDGNSYNFSFSKTGGEESKGKGLTGIDDDKYIYKFGLKMKADSDDKYKVVYATGDTGDDDAVVEEIDDAALRNLATRVDGKNKDNDTIKVLGTLDKEYYLVNSSGSIIKNKTAAKDGNDWYYYVNNKQIMMYTNNKTFSVDSGDSAITDEAGNSIKDDWKNGITNGNKVVLDDVIDRD